MRKIIFKALVLVFIVFAMSSIPCFCDPDESNDILTKQLDSINMESLQRYVDQINKDADGVIPKLDARQMIMGLFKGNFIVNLKDILEGLIKYLFKEVVANFDLLIKIIVISIICALLQNLHTAFESDTVGKMAYSICYILIALLAIQSFNLAMQYSISAIDTMVGFIQALLPTLLMLLASIGSITASTVFQPLVFVSIGVITTFIKTVIIPLVFFSAVLSIINNISDTINISKLATLIKQTAIGLLGITLTIFLGLISIQGIVAASVDSVALKSAKFAVDNFVPIIGGFLSDAFDTVVSCSMLIKNGIGIAGLIVLLLICAFPLIKMFSIILIYKIACALIQPILDNQIVQCLSDMSNSLMVLLVCVIAVGVLFFMSVTIIMGAGNMTVMLGR